MRKESFPNLAGKRSWLKDSRNRILKGFSGIQIPRQNVNQPSPPSSAVINLDDTSSSPEQRSHTCDGYKPLKDLYDRLENEINKLKDSYRSLLSDSREIQSTCKSCQNQQRIQEENRALREQLQLMKGNLDKTKEERGSLQMVVSLLSKELCNFAPTAKKLLNSRLRLILRCRIQRGRKQRRTQSKTMVHLNPYLPKERRIVKANRARKSRQIISRNSSNTLNHNQGGCSPTTVITGDLSTIIQGWQLGKEVGDRVVVKSSAGATTSDMKYI